ncbi:MAG: hypothetical protein HYX92_22785 [Chloroflexi bacterium]|nr:hypothetical protein [Chloroflexota bacterium]
MLAKRSSLAASCLTVLGLFLATCAPAAAPAATPKAAPTQPAAPTPKPGSTPAVSPAATTPSAKPVAPKATPRPSVEQPKYGGAVTRIRERYPDTLDPHLARGSKAWLDVLAPLYDGLLKLNENMEIVPGLAEKWEQPTDLVYVLHLFKGAKFHDNPVMKERELTSEDVRWNIQRMATNDPKFLRSWQFGVVASIETPDKHTVRLSLKEPTAPFLNYMAQAFNYMVGKEAVEKSGELVRSEAGTGPFYLKSWTEKISYKLAKNPSYFVRGIPYLDEVNVIIVPDPASRLAAFRSGRADYILVSKSDSDALKRTNPAITFSYLPFSFIFLAFNPANKPFTDQRVRQAISLATDRQALIDVVMDGVAELTGPVYGDIEASWRLPPEELKRLYKVDTPAARKLMAEAGYPNGFSLEIKASAQQKDCVDSVTVLAQQLKQIGVEVQMKVLEHTTFVAQRNAADYAAVLHSGGAAMEVGERIEQYWRIGGMYHLKDQDLGKLLDDQRREVNVARRRQIVNQFEQMMIERAYVLFLFGYPETLVRNPRIKGPRETSAFGQHLVARAWIDR